MESLVVRKLRRDMGQMSGEIQAGACHAQIPDDLARGDDERGDQTAGAVADVFVFAFFGFARFNEDRGMLSFEDLHAGFFVAADDQLAVLIQDGSLNVESADVLSFGVEVGIVAVEPVDAAMRFQVGGLQNTPDGGATHLIVGVLVDQVGCQIIDAHWLATQLCSAVLLVASVMTSSCLSGGKAPRPTGPWSILKTSETVLEIAGSPQHHGVATATHLVGNLQVGRLILGRQPQDQPAAKDQSLRGGMGSDESLQPLLFFEAQDNGWSKWVWHDRHPCRKKRRFRRADYQLDVNAPICLGQLQLLKHL